jgi:hypothetical protein
VFLELVLGGPRNIDPELIGWVLALALLVVDSRLEHKSIGYEFTLRLQKQRIEGDSLEGLVFQEHSPD